MSFGSAIGGIFSTISHRRNHTNNIHDFNCGCSVSLEATALILPTGLFKQPGPVVVFGERLRRMPFS